MAPEATAGKERNRQCLAESSDTRVQGKSLQFGSPSLKIDRPLLTGIVPIGEAGNLLYIGQEPQQDRSRQRKTLEIKRHGMPKLCLCYVHATSVLRVYLRGRLHVDL